jgi:hypothetical protein
MSDIRRFDLDTRLHHGLIHNGAVYLTGGSARREGKIKCGKRSTKSIRCWQRQELTRLVQMWLDDVRDFDEVHKVWDAWAPKAHAPARSSGQARMAKSGMLVELIVTAAA